MRTVKSVVADYFLRKRSSRTTSPLAIAPDAVVVDTTHLSLEEVVEQVCELVGALEA